MDNEKELSCKDCMHARVCKYNEKVYETMDKTTAHALDKISNNRSFIALTFVNNLAKYCKHYRSSEKTCSCNLDSVT